jgi:hypothetical protein
MIHFRDKTLCEFKKCAKFETCPRALTDDLIEQGRKWWGSDDFPVSIYISEPECYENPA